MKRNRRQKHPVFPKAPRGFWIRFQRRWSNPLKMLEEVISLSESFGAEAGEPRFKSMTDEYWLVMGSLHARTCLHARGVLLLLTYGIVDPAWRSRGTVTRHPQLPDSSPSPPKWLSGT